MHLARRTHTRLGSATRNFLVAFALLGAGAFPGAAIPAWAGESHSGVGNRSLDAPAALVAGACHTVLRGQTLYSLSRAYGVPLETLVEVNHLSEPSRIPAGRTLFIPGATGPREASPAPLLAWPIRGRITSPFGAREARERHQGLDIDGVAGQVVRAAAAGRVTWAGPERGYGNTVILDHGDDLSTVYAHASRLLVGVDEVVEAGEPIAEVGRTGNARGAHLHFETRRNGLPVDPLPLLGGTTLASCSP